MWGICQRKLLTFLQVDFVNDVNSESVLILLTWYMNHEIIYKDVYIQLLLIDVTCLPVL